MGQDDTLNYERVIAHIEPAFTDERGEISNILDGVTVQHVAIVTSVAGSRRGNHYHATQDQFIYVISGELISFSTPVPQNGHSVHVASVKAGDLLYCPAGVAHAYAFVKKTVFLNIDTGIRNPNTYADDTIPFTIAVEVK